MKHIHIHNLLFPLSYFFLFFAFTASQVMKESVFSYIVGLHVINYARLFSLFVLIPFILLYSSILDRFDKKTVVTTFLGVYALLQGIGALFLTHETIGLPNTYTHTHRLFGWLFFFLIECFAPFLLSVFWAFMNSVHTPEQAKKQYGRIVLFGTLGGSASAGVSWIYFAQKQHASLIEHAHAHQLLFICSTVALLLCVLLMHTTQVRTSKKTSVSPSSSSLFSGARIVVTQPYVFGIFTLVFLYETTSMIIAYLRLFAIRSCSGSICQTSALLFKISLLTHSASFLFALLGTRQLMMKIGERFCLLLIPGFIAVSFVGMLAWNFSFISVMAAFVCIRGLNYAFIRPVKETLYIPTDTDTRYKAKSWIDTIGTKLAKGGGSALNIATSHLSGPYQWYTIALIFSTISATWGITSACMGRQYQDRVETDA